MKRLLKKVHWTRNPPHQTRVFLSKLELNYSLATAERVPVTEVMIDVSSLEAALNGEAPYAIKSSTVLMFPAAAAT